MIPFWNYDSVFKTKEIIAKDRSRFARAWYRTYESYGDRGGPESEEAFNAWIKMIEEKVQKAHLQNAYRRTPFIYVRKNFKIK